MKKYVYYCEKCGHEWISDEDSIERCPRCKFETVINLSVNNTSNVINSTTSLTILIKKIYKAIKFNVDISKIKPLDAMYKNTPVCDINILTRLIQGNSEVTDRVKTVINSMYNTMYRINEAVEYYSEYQDLINDIIEGESDGFIIENTSIFTDITNKIDFEDYDSYFVLDLIYSKLKSMKK